MRKEVLWDTAALQVHHVCAEQSRRNSAQEMGTRAVAFEVMI
jgi:hypothetical protein